MRARGGWMLLVSLGLAGCEPVLAPSDFGEPVNPREEARILAEEYGRTARRLASLPESVRTRERASRHGIEVVDVLAEAAARGRPDAPEGAGGTVGIEVLLPGDRAPRAVLAPAFRSPSAPPLEVRADRFFVRVGNQHGEPRRTVALRDYLADVGRYVTSPASLTGAAALGERLSLSAPRDTHVLVEAQAVVVPVPARARASVRPVVWSRASSPRAPAVLAIVAATSGTSVRVIENRPDERSHLGSGQALDFNDGGQRRPLSVEPGAPSAIAVIEVPLLSGRVDVRRDMGAAARGAGDAAAPGVASGSRGEPAAVGGPFQEGSGDRVERDEGRPLRAMVFLLVPVAGGQLSDADWESIAGRVRAAARSPDAVGTLILPPGDARRRPL